MTDYYKVCAELAATTVIVIVLIICVIDVAEAVFSGCTAVTPKIGDDLVRGNSPPATGL